MMMTIIQAQDYLLKMMSCLRLSKWALADYVFEKLSAFDIFQNEISKRYGISI